MTLTEFPGAARVLAAQAVALPQPDQLCGPFSASVALAGILDDGIPTVTALALASGSTLWPGDIPRARPPRVPVTRDGWNVLPIAGTPEEAGTDAARLAAGIETLTEHRVSVIPVARPGVIDLRRLLGELLDRTIEFALLANVRTGPIVESDWDVGHFVVLWAFDQTTGDVAVADTYAELGVAGLPAGCRLVGSNALAEAMSADGGRGLLLLVPTLEHGAALDLAGDLGLRTEVWST
ncbi:DUF6885 family protein [Rhodococcoides yunnanense]|uniref:DUF6885 family protein n=1 Tax=Rhodococcoides yunnanense TaxID=278209 RepID=UPI00093333DA|nr:hypothetical protein [Rhodococcus yunnanensis]